MMLYSILTWTLIQSIFVFFPCHWNIANSISLHILFSVYPKILVPVGK